MAKQKHSNIYLPILMKTIARFLTVIFTLTGISNLFAQSTVSTDCVFGVTSAVNTETLANSSATWEVNAVAPLATDSLSYYDAGAPVHPWQVASQWGTSLYLFGPAQRFTLPDNNHVLDSVKITFGGFTGDKMFVGIYPDTVLPVNNGVFHLTNIFDQNVQPINQLAVSVPNTTNVFTLTIRYNGLAVPQNFHVVVTPNLTGTTFTSAFLLLGDSEATRVRTTENTHSSFIGINAQTLGFVAGPVDSFFIPPGDVEPIYSNFYVSAWTSAASSGVASNHNTSPISIWPNPASNSISVGSGAEIGSKLEIRDLLGRVVFTSRVESNKMVDIHTLPVGRYEAIMRTGDKFCLSPLIIQR